MVRAKTNDTVKKKIFKLFKDLGLCIGIETKLKMWSENSLPHSENKTETLGETIQNMYMPKG